MDEQKTSPESGTSQPEEIPSVASTLGQESMRKLYKSRSNRMIDGVCGGIAGYFGINITAVRLLLVAFTILSIGAGVIFYIVAMIIIPMKPLSVEMSAHDGTQTHSVQRGGAATGATATIIIGAIVIIIGVTLLFDYYDVFSVASMWHSFGKLALPIIFILIGGALLLGKDNGEVRSTGSHGDVTLAIERKRLSRSNLDKKISGVCGGFAAYFGVDSTIVRLIFISLAFASFGLALILYIACAFVIPKKMDL